MILQALKGKTLIYIRSWNSVVLSEKKNLQGNVANNRKYYAKTNSADFKNVRNEIYTYFLTKWHYFG